MISNIKDLLFLYFGRTVGLFVGFIALPLYRDYLGEYAFSLVVVYLTCSAIAVMLDFGLATFINREAAFSEGNKYLNKKMISCEMILLFTLLFFLTTFMIIKISLGINMITTIFFLSAISIFLNVLNNLYSFLWLGLKEYTTAGLIQGGVSIFKSLLAILVIFSFSPTIEGFLISQIVAVLIVNLISRNKIKNELEGIGFTLDKDIFDNCLIILRKTLPILLFSISGAAVLQLDKLIISTFSGLEFVSNYYLAMTLSMLPITVFSAPVSQFFQPKIVSYINDTNAFSRTMKQYIVLITLVASVTTITLYLFRNELITMWLGKGEDTHLVISYVTYMLPGLFLGALGFVPCSVLIAKEKYKLQAKVSVGLTIITLSFVLYFASEKNITLVCISYAAYHACSTGASWLASLFSLRNELPNLFRLFSLQCLLALCCILFLI